MDNERYTCIALRNAQNTLAEDVRQGLTAPRKWLPCKYFYDPEGNALFGQISELPEYYLTRVETAILNTHAARIIERCPSDLALVELGSGNSTKSRYLIEPCLVRQEELTYYAVDISPTGLEDGTRQLLHDYPHLRVVGVAAEFEDGLRYLAGGGDSGPRLVVFLGSTIGNFTEEEIAGFFAMLRSYLHPTDRLLLGVDLIKDPAVLKAAYDDAQGVTAKFNLNILTRLNQELSANFDLTAFRHRAVWNYERSRIEMHLVSLRDQHVGIANLDLDIEFRQDETIHTENCYKYSQGHIESLLADHGFQVLGAFSDPQEYFCLFLAS
ncbi:L-histidine N(alpha)-methyltransferase [Candidatus Methylomirabilis sp.]|uniref:4-dimethylallyltryptophan N-methyltransferase n=1 Tax=Candidatus Methylomirabilis tolerans TaxID=3123416 RepID=A0AAJ1AH85_9BACT|nr:L-histidine N(alpha)-methyltransferase [Candidatus Methylomirabilis sp.]